MISRRQLLQLALLSPLAAALPQRPRSRSLRTLLMNAPSDVLPAVVDMDMSRVKVERRWDGPVCHSQIVNRGRDTIDVIAVTLFNLKLPLPPSTKLYGEGFQMLSQTGGTLGQPVDLGNYTDAKHYKMPIPVGTRAFYGLMTLAPPDGTHLLLAFTSCRRFIGQFYLRDNSLQVVVDTEGMELKPGETLELEEFTF